MRRANAVISMALMILFFIHMIWGGLELVGIISGGSYVFSIFTYLMVILLCVHVVIGIIYTIRTIMVTHKAGRFYIRENMLFLIRRISGFALLIFATVHMFIFHGRVDGGHYYLSLFDMGALISQILLVLSLVVHLICNITPLRISLGITDKMNLRTDIILVISIVLMMSAVAFIIYYLRWQMV